MAMVRLICILFTIIAMPISMSSQSFSDLWGKFSEAQKKDLPKTQIEVLQSIIDKADKSREYGHLLKAQLKKVEAVTAITPDSLNVEVDKLVQLEKKAETRNPVLAAVYQAVLGAVYQRNPTLDEKCDEISKNYFAKAMSNPTLLASTKTDAFVPLLIKGDDSQYYNHDLLSPIASLAGDMEALHLYYSQNGNREAACLSACQLLKLKSGRSGILSQKERTALLQEVDSLIDIYGDLDVAGELAIQKAQLLSSERSITAAERIQYVDDARARWSNWPRINTLLDFRNMWINPQFTVDFGSLMLLPGTTRTVKLSYIRHINAITMRIVRVNVDGSRTYNLSNDKDWGEIENAIVAGSDIVSRREYTGHPDYELFEDSVSIGPLPLGAYLAEFKSDVKGVETVRMLFYVSDVFLLSQPLPKGKERHIVVSATTGKPLKNAKVRISEYRDTIVVDCNKKGEATVEKSGDNNWNGQFFAYTPDDKYCPEQNFWRRNYTYNAVRPETTYYRIFTDRSIYRPGQTVQAAVMAFVNREGVTTNVISGKSLKVMLRDANHKLIATKEVVTDEFGKAPVDFTLPESGLTGRFFISTESETTSFMVEEYKRPTFDLEFDTYDQPYKNGDIISVKGHAKTYSGVPVQSAKVSYTVSRKRNSWWWNPGGHDEGDAELLVDSTTTDEKGCFVIKMPMQLPESSEIALNYRSPQFYRIVAEVVVTDQAGESHDGECSMPISNREKAFSFTMPKNIERGQTEPVTFHLRNLVGNPVDGEVTYTIDDHEDRYTVKANTPVDVWESPWLKNSGKHIIKAVCEGDTVKAEFVLFSLKDKKPSFQTHDWFYASKDQFPNDGSPVYVQVGSSDPETMVFYQVFSEDNVLEQGSFKLDNANQTREWVYKEEYGTGVLLTYAWVRDGVAYTHEHQITRPLPDKRIILNWESFRDRLTPGSEEEWTLRATYPDGKPADAQMVATIYDHSLDQINQHSWWFNPYIRVNVPHAGWNSTSYNSLYSKASNPITYQKVPALNFTHFDEAVFTFWNPRVRMYKSVGSRGMVLQEVALRAPMAEANAASANVAMDSSADLYDSLEESKAVEEDNSAGSEEKVADQLRENLNETAAFFPQAAVDQNGRITLKFRLPESVTTWRIMGLVTDKELNHGSITSDAVAQKDVMIVPNMPRFVRLGDRAQISAQIFNTTVHPVQGKALIELSDPESEAVVFSQTKDFSVDVEQTAAVTFDYLPEGMPRLLVCKVMAKGEGFSDGEQHYLPVLSNMELVTRTLPFTQHGAQVSTFDLDRLFPKGISDGKLTVEYTNNPAWLMIQALPTMAAEQNENAISQAMSYYANTLGLHIMNMSPAIKSMVLKWNEEQQQDNLVSNLNKNAELKNLLLNETPWVSQADHEEGQKRSLVKFFDEDTNNQRRSSAVKILRELQNSDGSWSWWKGMEGSPYMTVAVSEMLIRLNVLAGKQSDTQGMINRACSYMGTKLIEDMNEIKKLQQKGKKRLPSELSLHILYNLALDGRTLSDQVQEAADFLIELFEKESPAFTIYGKAHGAVILAHYGRKQKAEEYMKSLDEYAVSTEEMGRYYDTRKAQYSWCSYLIPTEVAAIEAYKRLKPDQTKVVDEMRRWLLQQKRAQMWNTPVNSVDAVYAFLEGNLESLDNGVESRISLDGQTMQMPQATAGVGYVKQAVAYDGQRKVEVEKSSSGTSWGAIYAQFMQKAMDVEKSSAGLTVTREVRTSSPSLKVGDKVVVRITVKAERDMDFVEVIDRRAACLEPVSQLSGYHYGYYIAPKDYTTAYYFNKMPKGTHVVETEYFIDRAGSYESGTCKAQCAYAPEYSSTCGALKFDVNK